MTTPMSIPPNCPPFEYAPGSSERKSLMEAINKLKNELPVKVPVVIDGKEIYDTNVAKQVMPSNHKLSVCTYSQVDREMTQKAIDGALKAKPAWEDTPMQKRIDIFLRAAQLVETKYRFEVVAASMLGQGKNAWQAEIDAAAEAVDFFRFISYYASQIESMQPPVSGSPGVTNVTEWKGLEGFGYAIAPFNFTCLGPSNLTVSQAIMGNVVLLKPSPSAVLGCYVLYKAMVEAGVPAGVVQFVPGDAEEITDVCLTSPDFASLSYIGSTAVFRSLWKKVGDNMLNYKNYPRLSGETGGKDYHLVHPSVSGALLKHTVMSTIRAAFEYQGQKCSACSRNYIAESVWNGGFKDEFVKQTRSIVTGPVEEWTTFNGPVIHRAAFDRCKAYIEDAKKDPSCTILAGGNVDDSVGYYVEPTIIETTDPKYKSMVKEIFGPITTVYVYKDKDFEDVVQLVDQTSEYGLTGTLFIDPSEKETMEKTSRALLYSAGNFYFNDKCTGATVGNQPFSGGRMSGTNDKSATLAQLLRFTSPRVIKTNSNYLSEYIYPSNVA